MVGLRSVHRHPSSRRRKRIGHGADGYGECLEGGGATLSEHRLKAKPRQLKDHSRKRVGRRHRPPVKNISNTEWSVYGPNWQIRSLDLDPAGRGTRRAITAKCAETDDATAAPAV